MSPASLSPSLADKIKAKALELGFDAIGFSSAEISAKDQISYQEWCQSGLAAGLEFLTRHPEIRKNLRLTKPWAKTAISLAAGYFQGPLPPKPGTNFGRIARYAWGQDYHDVISQKLNLFSAFLQEELGQNTEIIFGVDSIPVLEKSLAKSAGLGFTGKNSVLIGSSGSWFFLSEIIISEPLLQPDRNSPEKNCGECVRCQKICPTGALEITYRLNAGKCISYLTVENKGWIPREMRKKIGDWIFGCDLCQDVCPFNSKPTATPWKEFKPDQRTGAWLNLEEILKIPDQETFKTRFAGTSLLRAKRKGMIRNCCVAAGNSGNKNFIPLLKNLLEDPESMIRGHAIWALSELIDPKILKPILEKQLKIETDALVREELSSLYEN